MILTENFGLRDGLFGMVNLKTSPFQIQLNGKVVPMRKQISLIHEMLHVWTKLFKIPMSHPNLHRLAVGIHSDLLPVLKQLKLT